MHRGTVVAVLAFAIPARADGPITSRDYAIEIYDGVALGNTAQVGMGGAGAALVVGTAGTLINASAPAVRLTTDTNWWGWDYHVDYLTGQFSSDYDNNGIVAPKGSGASLLTLGIGGRLNNWALALTGTWQTAPVEGSNLFAQTFRGKVALAKWFPGIDTAIGLGVQTVIFGIAPQRGQNLFSINGGGAIAGATWIPRYQNFRVGLATESQILGGVVRESNCDPSNCMGYILPEAVQAPWRVVMGGAYRISETQWNQLVGGWFRDEPSLTVAADLVVTGATPDGHGIEAFGLQQLQRAGTKPVVSVRAGAEYEWLPGRLRVRAGSYWEPSRFEQLTGYRETSGRIHGTFGAEVRVFEFNLWGRRRGRVSFTGDIAARYRNLAISIGFWH